MPTPDLWPDVACAAYYIAGLPVAWWHLRRERVSASDIPGPKPYKSFQIIMLVLALLWPILLLAFAAAWLGNRGDKPSPRK